MSVLAPSLHYKTLTSYHADITTTMTASGLAAGARPSVDAPFASDRRVLAGLVALVGGLVGAAVVL